MTKVLLVTKLFAPVIGGVETVVAQLAAALAEEEGFEVTVLAGNETKSKEDLTYTWKGANIIKAASAGTVYNTTISFRYFSLLKKLVASHDIIHFHTPNPLGTVAQYFLRIPHNKRIFVSVHADMSLTGKARFAFLYNFFLRKALKRAEIITTASPQNLELFGVLQPFVDKCEVIPFAYDEENTVDVSSEQIVTFKENYGIDDRYNQVLFVGRLSQDKGLTYLLDALVHLRAIQLVIVGEGPESAALKKQASELLQFNNCILFTGPLHGANLACAYRSSLMLALPSIRETFGIVQAEAMYFGLPVINTRLNTGVNFVSIHNQTGFTVEPGNAMALAKAIESILKSRDQYARFSDNARERSKLFSPHRMTDIFRKLYLQEYI